MSGRYSLRGWKEIARYLGVSVRTVRRWRRSLGLPVWQRCSGGMAFACPDELDEWVRSGASEHPDRVPYSVRDERKPGQA